MDEEEEKLFESVVHSLRNKGWSRIDAEGKALDTVAEHRAEMAAAKEAAKEPGTAYAVLSGESIRDNIRL